MTFARSLGSRRVSLPSCHRGQRLSGLKAFQQHGAGGRVAVKQYGAATAAKPLQRQILTRQFGAFDADLDNYLSTIECARRGNVVVCQVSEGRAELQCEPLFASDKRLRQILQPGCSCRAERACNTRRKEQDRLFNSLLMSLLWFHSRLTPSTIAMRFASTGKNFLKKY